MKKRFPLVLSSLVLSLVVAGCASSGGDAAPRGADATEADATAYRLSQQAKSLQQQVNPPLDSPLQVLEFAEPRYPSFLLSDHTPSARGTVVISFEILPSGYVGATKVLSNTDEALNKPAVNAMRNWRFAPPLRDGKPVRLFLQHSFRMAP